MGLPFIPPATASVRPLMQAPMQIGARLPAQPPHLLPGQVVRPPSTANTVVGKAGIPVLFSAAHWFYLLRNYSRALSAR